MSWWCKVQDYLTNFIGFMTTTFELLKALADETKLKIENTQVPAASATDEEENSPCPVPKLEIPKQTLKDLGDHQREEQCKEEVTKPNNGIEGKNRKFENCTCTKCKEQRKLTNVNRLIADFGLDLTRNEMCAGANDSLCKNNFNQALKKLEESEETLKECCEVNLDVLGKPELPVTAENTPEPVGAYQTRIYQELHLQDLSGNPISDQVRYGIVGIQSTPQGNVYILSSAIPREETSEKCTIEELEESGSEEESETEKLEENVEKIKRAQQILKAAISNEAMPETNCEKLYASYLKWLSMQQKIGMIKQSQKRLDDLKELTGLLGHIVADKKEKIEEVTTYRKDLASEELSGIMEHIVADRVKKIEEVTTYRKDLDADEMIGIMEHIVAYRTARKEAKEQDASEAYDEYNSEGGCSEIRKVVRNRYFKRQHASRSRSRRRSCEKN